MEIFARSSKYFRNMVSFSKWYNIRKNAQIKLQNNVSNFDEYNFNSLSMFPTHLIYFKSIITLANPTNGPFLGFSCSQFI